MIRQQVNKLVFLRISLTLYLFLLDRLHTCRTSVRYCYTLYITQYTIDSLSNKTYTTSWCNPFLPLQHRSVPCPRVWPRLSSEAAQQRSRPVCMCIPTVKLSCMCKLSHQLSITLHSHRGCSSKCSRRPADSAWRHCHSTCRGTHPYARADTWPTHRTASHLPSGYNYVGYHHGLRSV